MTENDMPQDDIDINKRSARLDALSEHLTQSLEPQKRIFSVPKRMALWLAVSFVYIAAIVLVGIPLRNNVFHYLLNTSLSFDVLISFIMGCGSAYAALRLMVPVSGPELKRVVALPLVMVAMFLMWTIYRTVIDTLESGFLEILNHYPCFDWGIIFVVIPLAALAYLAKRGASTHPYWLHFMALISMFSFGWICLRLTCQQDHASHAFIYHFLPFLLIGVVSALFTRQLFKSI